METMATELVIDDAALADSIELAPEEPSLPLGEWVRKNLFSSLFNTALTLAFAAFVVGAMRVLLNFVFSDERQWVAIATNLKLMLTQGYPENQYVRIWVSVAIIVVLIGLSIGVRTRTGGVSLKRISIWFVSFGSGILVAGVVAGIRPRFLLVGAILLAIGAAIWYGFGEVRRRGTFIPTNAMIYGGFALLLLSLWVVPYGHYAFKDGEFIAESGRTVANTTKQPWTVMWVLSLVAFFAARPILAFLGTKFKVLLGLLWVLAPYVIVWVVLRDPALDWDHVWSTDIPMALAFAALGGAVIYALTKPGLGEIGRVLAALLLGVAVFHFVAAFFGWYPMLQKARISFFLLALVAMAAPNFAGDRKNRLRLVYFWVGLTALVHYMATMANTASTVKIQTDFFLGGLTLSLFIAVTTILLSFPLGVLLALGRTSTLPIFRVMSTAYIETIRGVPLITILFFFSIILNLFLPSGMEISETAAIVTGFSLFSAAYLAENVRGGLQSIRRGQFEAADAMGLTTAQRTGFIVLPQALRVSIPPLVGQVIATFKETSLVAIVGGFDLLRIANNVIPAQSEFLGAKLEGLLVVSLFYWVGAFSMSKYSQKLERDLGVGER